MKSKREKRRGEECLLYVVVRSRYLNDSEMISREKADARLCVVVDYHPSEILVKRRRRRRKRGGERKRKSKMEKRRGQSNLNYKVTHTEDDNRSYSSANTIRWWSGYVGACMENRKMAGTTR